MSAIEFDFRPDISSCVWIDDWKEMQIRVCGTQGTHIKDPVTEELVIKTLRSEQLPETVYWLLRYYVEANRNRRLINTDKGKSIFIDHNHLDNTITVYVGSTDSVFCIGEEDGRKIYTMDVSEKCEYVWYEFLHAALKRRFSASAIIDQAMRENNDDVEFESFTPALIFTTGFFSTCTLRTDWDVAGTARPH